MLTSRTQPVRARMRLRGLRVAATLGEREPRDGDEMRRERALGATSSTFARRSSIVPPFFASAAGSTRSASALVGATSANAATLRCTSASSAAIATATCAGSSGEVTALSSART